MKRDARSSRLAPIYDTANAAIIAISTSYYRSRANAAVLSEGKRPSLVRMAIPQAGDRWKLTPL